ncbi:MAG: archaeal proteasome endopeptidase complex subunit alpha [Candidatus Aenigmarchaeota archaeon]|nr:archaeal proteasome endopeptidase complex subunit alpha [Candidatus Aenigmarchaeota archaeon]
MEISPPMKQMGYDRAIVVFSPEGRIYQVEYAQKNVEKVSTVLGIVFANGIVLAAGKQIQRLLVPESAEKISVIDRHIAIGSCGILADARNLIDFARIKSQVNKLTFNEPIETYALSKDIADRIQRFTQMGGIRPYGVGLLIAGMDGDPRLFETDPSGSLREWKAHAIGRGAKESRELIIEEYKDGMTRDKALDLAIRALKTGEKKLTSRTVELAIVMDKEVKKYTRPEVKEMIKKYM